METLSPLSKPLAMIYVRRWFDKINGNSYFNYYITIKTDKDYTLIPAKNNLQYGYGSHCFDTAKKHLTELQYNLNDLHIEEIDLGYGLQRDMKNMNK